MAVAGEVDRVMRAVVKHPGKLTIGYPSGGRNDREAYIYLTDGSSGCVVFEVTISRANLMEALACRAEQACEFEIIGIANVGKVHEGKVEKVLVPDNMRHVMDADSVDSEGSRAARKLLAPLTVDGWTPRLTDLFNHQRYLPDKAPKGKRWVSVSFHRFVDAPQTKGD